MKSKTNRRMTPFEIIIDIINNGQPQNVESVLE
jgi:hypothetical protein